jgi:hypothetical protein
MTKKTVKFDSIVRVAHINTRSEYQFFEVDKDMWWSTYELDHIRKSILIEIRDMMQQRPELSFDACQKEILKKTT